MTLRLLVLFLFLSDRQVHSSTHVISEQHTVQRTGLQTANALLSSGRATCIVLGMVHHQVAAIVHLKGRSERHAGSEWMPDRDVYI